MSLRQRDNSHRYASALGGPRKATAAEPGQLARALWAKAQVASRSARLLLERGDPDGALDRGYYAMFSAARAALAAIRSSLAVCKKHGTIFRRFDKYLVQERGFNPSLGKAFLARQRSVRQAADYGQHRVDEAIARVTVCEMDKFLAAIEPFLAKVKP